MKYSEFLSEIQKAHGWTGHGDPEVVVDGYEPVLARVANGKVYIDTDYCKKRAEADNIIEGAETEANNAIWDVERKLEDILANAEDEFKAAMDTFIREIQDISHEVR